jgi:hypothetical protein
MTLSGQTIFDLPFTDAIEEAWERAVGTASGSPRSGYDMRSSRRSINLLFTDWANRGLNLWSYTERTQLLTYGVGEYNIAPNNDLVDVIEQVVQLPPGSTGQQVSRYNMTRVSVSTHATRTNPTITGRPVEVFYQRKREGITAYVWPLPGDSGPYTLVMWVLRRMDDAGAYTNTSDMPFRFLPAFTAGLAFYIAQKQDPNNIALIQRLEADYDRTWQRAADEDREKATLKIAPRSSSYRVVS